MIGLQDFADCSTLACSVATAGRTASAVASMTPILIVCATLEDYTDSGADHIARALVAHEREPPTLCRTTA